MLNSEAIEENFGDHRRCPLVNAYWLTDSVNQQVLCREQQAGTDVDRRNFHKYIIGLMSRMGWQSVFAISEQCVAFKSLLIVHENGILIYFIN